MMKEDWVECTLGEILNIERGGSPRPIKEYITTDNNGVNWIKIGDATNSTKYILQTLQKIKPSGLKNSREVFPGDLILSNSMSFGRPYIMGIHGAIHDGWLVLRDNKYLNKDFLYFALSSPLTFNQFSENAKGSTVKNLNIELVSDVRIKLFPLPIQRAIVAKIEELFSSLDSGIADLKKAQEQLVIYRQAVLKKAFEGELTKEWREKQTNLPSADELFETIKITEDLPKIPTTWKWIKSNELFSFVTSGSRGWAKYYSDSGAIFIRITNLNFNTLELDLSPEKIQFVNPPIGSEGIRTKVNKDDFLFSITGYLGMFAIAPDLKDAFVNQHVSLCRPKEGFNKIYLGYWVISKSGGIHYLNKNQKGAVKAGLNLDDLKSFPVPLCSKEEQHQIVLEIESRLSVCDKVEESIAESLIKATALRQSILKKAFEGKLLSEAEVAKCKLEKDYEPASVLLERIKEEKRNKK